MTIIITIKAMEYFPDNHRTKWSDDEIKKLLHEIKKKTPFHQIAENHQRTIGAIKYKLIRYAIDEIKDNDNDLSIDYLMKITNLSREELLEGFKKLNFEYNDKSDDSTRIIISKLDDIDSNIKQIWACLFTYIIFHFMVNFKTLTNYL